MSYWDSEKQEIIRYKDEDCGNGWILIDCGCCNGLEWGGYEPRECSRCEGRGFIYKHKKSGVLAIYPGGKFVG